MGSHRCFRCAPQWTLSNALQFELHPLARLSFGARLSLRHQWRLFTLPLGPDERLPAGVATSQATETLNALLFVSFSATRNLGLTVDVSSTAVPRSGGGGRVSIFAGLFFANPADNNTRVGVSLWFRSSPGLSKFWML